MDVNFDKMRLLKLNILFILIISSLHAREYDLTLLPPSTQPLKDINLTLHVKDKNSNFITNNITWIVKPKGSIKENGSNIITPLKDTTITLQAKHNNIISNPITLHVKWIVNNHELPPEPDPKINNSTLLGIDVNGNGVRDDVERWIYETYKDKHPVHIDIGMQQGRACKKVLVIPEKALEITEEVDASLACSVYLKRYTNLLKNTDIYNNSIGLKVQKKYFNTKERVRIYREEYDKRLSGHVFTLPWASESRKYCDFNLSKYEE